MIIRYGAPQIYPQRVFEIDVAQFAWLNQGPATVDAATQQLYFETTSTGNVNTISGHFFLKTAPAGAWTITAAFVVNGISLPNTYCGLAVRETSTGRLITFGWESNNQTNRIHGFRWASVTVRPVLSAILGNMPHYNFSGSQTFFRLIYNGSNLLTLATSKDDTHYITLGTEAIGGSAYVGALNEFGFFLSNENALGPIGMTVEHWEEP